MIPVEHQAARPQDRGQPRVHQVQRVRLQPVQRRGAHRRVRRPVQAERRGPTVRAQVHIGEPETVALAVRGAAERQQHRVGVDGDDAGGGHPVQQPDRQRPGTAAQVEDERVAAPGGLLDRVDEGGEALLPVGQVPLLLDLPPGDPALRGLAVQYVLVLVGHARLLVTDDYAFASQNVGRGV